MNSKKEASGIQIKTKIISGLGEGPRLTSCTGLGNFVTCSSILPTLPVMRGTGHLSPVLF